MVSAEEYIILLRLVEAIKDLIFAKDFCPGDDLGAEEIAIAFVEIRKCLKQLEDLRNKE